MQEGLPYSTGSCALAREWEISKAPHNKKNSTNLTFSDNGNVNMDIFTSIIWCQLHRLSSSTIQHSPVGLPVAKPADNVTFDHFRVKFCPILDKMMFYSSLHLYCIKLSAKCFKIFHCRERMAWTEVLLQKLKIFYSLSSITLIKYGRRTCINSILQFLNKYGLR